MEKRFICIFIVNNSAFCVQVIAWYCRCKSNGFFYTLICISFKQRKIKIIQNFNLRKTNRLCDYTMAKDRKQRPYILNLLSSDYLIHEEGLLKSLRIWWKLA